MCPAVVKGESGRYTGAVVWVFWCERRCDVKSEGGEGEGKSEREVMKRSVGRTRRGGERKVMEERRGWR